MGEHYISFDTAMLLRHHGYELNMNIIPQINVRYYKERYEDDDMLYDVEVVTSGAAINWIRDTFKIHIQISIDYTGKYYGVFFDTEHPMGTVLNDTDMFSKAEDAMEAAIIKALNDKKQIGK